MLPEKFAIHNKNNNDKKFREYIYWLNNKNKSILIGSDYNSYYHSNGILSSEIEEGFVEITLEQFFKMKEEKEFIPIVGKEYLFYCDQDDKYREVYVGKTRSGLYVSHEINDEEEVATWYCIEDILEIEVTLEQIAEKFNVSVENLKIKK